MKVTVDGQTVSIWYAARSWGSYGDRAAGWYASCDGRDSGPYATCDDAVGDAASVVPIPAPWMGPSGSDPRGPADGADS